MVFTEREFSMLKRAKLAKNGGVWINSQTPGVEAPTDIQEQIAYHNREATLTTSLDAAKWHRAEAGRLAGLSIKARAACGFAVEAPREATPRCPKCSGTIAPEADGEWEFFCEDCGEHFEPQTLKECAQFFIVARASAVEAPREATPDRLPGEHDLLRLSQEFVRTIEDNWELPEEKVFDGMNDWFLAWMKSFKREVARAASKEATTDEIRNAALEEAATVAEYHHANHCENQDGNYRNCGTAIATGIRDLKSEAAAASSTPQTTPEKGKL